MQSRFIKLREIVLLFIVHLPFSVQAQNTGTISLQNAIDIALRQNPLIQAARNEVDASRGRSWGRWWLPNPTLRAEFEGVPNGLGLGAFGERKLQISQAIEFPVNIYFNKKLADSDIKFFRMNLEQTKLEVTAAIKKAYFQFLEKRHLHSLAQRNVGLFREIAGKARTRYEAGEASRLELVRTKLAEAEAENLLRRSKSDVTASQASLNALLARPADLAFNPEDSLTYSQINISLSEAKGFAMEHHPRLKARDFRVAMAEQQRNLAWGSFLPQLEVSAFRQKIDGNPNFYGMEFGFSLPIWFPFRQRGQIQEANATLQSERFRLDNERLLVESEIEAVFAYFKASQEEVHHYSNTLLQQAKEVQRIASRSYEEGEIGYLQLLEAQQSLIGIRRGYIEALAAYQAAVAELEKAAAMTFVQEN